MNAVAGVVDAAAVNVQDFAGETRGVIGAAVVDDDYLGVGPTLAQVVYDRRQGVSQAGRLVISRNNDRERRRHSVSALYHSALGAVVELAPWCGRPEHVRATGPKARTEGSQRQVRARRARRPWNHKKGRQPRRGNRDVMPQFCRPSGPDTQRVTIQGLRARFARAGPWLPSARAFGAASARAFGAASARAFGAAEAAPKARAE